MLLKDHFELLSIYNQWMNSKLYEAASQLSDTELATDRGAFFGSILGTLNHIMVGDIIWLKRLANHPACVSLLRETAGIEQPTRLDQMLFKDLGRLSQQRTRLDSIIINWIAELSEDDLNVVLTYHNTQGVAANKRYSSLVYHFFNHQTHHRGQVSTLLLQAGVDIGDTDLLALIPDESGV